MTGTSGSDSITTSVTALLLIDVVNDLDFPEGEQLLQYALPMAEQLRNLKQCCRQHKVPVIYVNDNFGRWQSDFRGQVDRCLAADSRGRTITQLLLPDTDDYFVLKPKHSGFYCTVLELLLRHLQVRRLIITGLAGNLCVLFTAHDAYLRDYKLIVPSDGVASNTAEQNRQALDHMALALKADVMTTKQLMANLVAGRHALQTGK